MGNITTLLGSFIDNNYFKDYHTGEVFKILTTSNHVIPLNKYVFIKVHTEYNMYVLDDLIGRDDGR